MQQKERRSGAEWKSGSISRKRIQMKKKNLYSEILRLAIPIILEQMATILLGVVNTIMVGQLGKEAVAAVGNVDTLSRCIFPIFAGIGVGATILIAQAIGKKREEEACDITKQALYAGFLLAILITGVLIATRRQVLYLLLGHTEESVMQLAGIYYRITILSYPFMFVYYVINGVLRGSGDTKTPLAVTVIMNVINAAMSYLLIYGVSLPDFGVEIDGLGVTGAAIAITIARVFGAAMNVCILLRGKNTIRLKQWNKWKINTGIFGAILKTGIPYGLEQFALQTGKLVLQVIINGMGTVAIAANTIGMSIMSVCNNFGYGFNLAAVTLVGQAIGAGKPEKAHTYTKGILKMNLLAMSAISALIILFAPKLFALYTDDGKVIACGVDIIRIYAFSQPFLAIDHVLGGSLRGAGDTRYPMITTFIGVWLLRLVFGYILGVLLHMGIRGVWIAMTVDLAIRSVLYFLRYRKGYLKNRNDGGA